MERVGKLKHPFRQARPTLKVGHWPPNARWQTVRPDARLDNFDFAKSIFRAGLSSRLPCPRPDTKRPDGYKREATTGRVTEKS